VCVCVCVCVWVCVCVCVCVCECSITSSHYRIAQQMTKSIMMTRLFTPYQHIQKCHPGCCICWLCQVDTSSMQLVALIFARWWFRFESGRKCHWRNPAFCFFFLFLIFSRPPNFFLFYAFIINSCDEYYNLCADYLI